VADLWPWLVVAGLGAFHGINPAMGWLFAVALGLHRGSGRVVALALPPIALGHALAVLVAVGVFLLLGLVVELHWLRRLAGLVLIGWAASHWWRGSRHRVRFGMTVGWLGLAAWSFLMASAHGAGLMLIPALVPICFTGDTLALGDPFAASTGLALLAVLLHAAAMLTVTAATAFVVYRFVGVAILRTAWINLDLLWTVALVLAGALLLIP
jgi:hypothetical protein